MWFVRNDIVPDSCSFFVWGVPNLPPGRYNGKVFHGDVPRHPEEKHTSKNLLELVLHQITVNGKRKKENAITDLFAHFYFIYKIIKCEWHEFQNHCSKNLYITRQILLRAQISFVKEVWAWRQSNSACNRLWEETRVSRVNNASKRGTCKTPYRKTLGPNPRPSCCEATVLTTKQLRCPNSRSKQKIC